MSEEKRKPREPDSGEPSPYLRRSRHVEVRRSAVRLRRFMVLGTLLTLLAGGVAAAAAYGVNTYLVTSPRYKLRDTLWIAGSVRVPREQLEKIFAADAGRSVFDVPLERRRNQVMSIPWIESVHILRGWPNRLRVVVRERRPVAFVRVAAGAETRQGRLWLIDSHGVLLPLPRNASFSLPVLTGIRESQTLEERRNRVGLMLAVLTDLDRETPHRSPDISELDLTDPDDAAITVTASGSPVLVHLGRANFLDRYKVFLENIEHWREQYGSVRSVDLRFEKQVVVKP
jgi:cell division protein FtsQ